MKTANFISKYTIGFGDRQCTSSMYCTVTLKDDGKTSISLGHDASYRSFSERFQARKLAAEIVKADFKHPAVTHFKESNKGLEALLFQQTTILHKEFLQRTKEYAAKRFAWAAAFSKLSLIQVLKQAHCEHKIKVNETGRQLEQYELSRFIREKKTIIEVSFTTISKYAKEDMVISRDLVKKGFTKFLKEEVDHAEEHYQSSIKKLAYRLGSNGVENSTDFKIHTARIGRNIETTIKCKDGRIIRAWTIIAEGVVQRAHFRYLIKIQK